MTFAPDTEMGSGILVPCKLRLSTINALFCEAKALWKAEFPKAQPGDISEEWGCVGILFHPRAALENWRQEWREYFCSKKAGVVSPVSGDGLLCIPWPVEVSNDNEVNVDVILATATKGDCTTPTPENVADAWIEQNNGDESYFFGNVRCGIRTPDDGPIWRRIEEKKPLWMNKDEYSKEVDVLRVELKN